MASTDRQHRLETDGTFDPYYTWLGIAPDEQPANHYRLLGVRPFESNPDVISNAADRQMAHLRTFQAGPRSTLSQRLLNEVAAARICLLNAAKKEKYDSHLHETAVVKVVIGSANGGVRHTLEPPPRLPRSPEPATRPLIVTEATERVRNARNGTRNQLRSRSLIAGGSIAAVGAVAIGGAIAISTSGTGESEENVKKVHEMTKKDLVGTTHGQPELPVVPKFDPTKVEMLARNEPNEPEISLPEVPLPNTDVELIDPEKSTTPESDIDNADEPSEGNSLAQEDDLEDKEDKEHVASIIAAAKQMGQKSRNFDALLIHAFEEKDPEKRAILALAAAHVSVKRNFDLKDLTRSLNAALNKGDGPLTNDDVMRYRLSLIDDISVKDSDNYGRAYLAKALLESLHLAYEDGDFEQAEAILEKIRKHVHGNGKKLYVGKSDYREKGAPIIEALKEAQDQNAEYLSIYNKAQSGLGANGEPKDESAHFDMGMYLATAQGNWKKASEHFLQGNNSSVAEVAEMEQNLSPNDAAGMVDLAYAWVAAGGSVSEEHSKVFYEHAAKMHQRVVDMSVGGKAELDAKNGLADLADMGVRVEKKKRDNAETTEGEKTSSTSLTTLTPLFSKAHMTGEVVTNVVGIPKMNDPPIIDGKVQSEYLCMNAPAIVTYNLPEDATKFEATLYCVHPRSDGVIYNVIVDNKQIFTTGLFKGMKQVSIPLPRNSRIFSIVTTPGPQNDESGDHAFLVHPQILQK